MEQDRESASGRIFGYGALLLASAVIIMRPLFSGVSAPFFSNMIVVLLIYAAFALWVFEMIVRRRILLYRSGLGIFIAVFILGIVVAILWSSYPRAGIGLLIHFLSYALLFLIVFDLCVRKGLSRYFLILLLASCLITTLYGIYQYFVFFPQWLNDLDANSEKVLAAIGASKEMLPEIASRIKSKEVFSTFFLSNAFAGFLVILFPVQLGFLIESLKSKKRISTWLVIIVSILSLVLIIGSMHLSRSLGGIVSFVFALLVFAALLAKEWMKRHWLKILIPLVIIIVALVGLRRRLPKMHLETMVKDSLRVRMGFWEGATSLIATHPWLGVGPGNFGDYYLQVKSAGAHEVQNAHNNFLQLWAECGPLATFAFAVMLCLALTRTYSAIRTYEKDRKEKKEGPAESRSAFFVVCGICGGILAFVLLLFIIRPFDLPLSTNLWVPVLWLAFAVALLHFSGNGEAVSRPFIAYGAFAGICGFILHSFVDFDLYVPGIAQTLFVVIAAAIGLKSETPRRKLMERAVGAPGQLVFIAVVAGLFFFFLFGVVQPLNEASRFYEQARVLFLEREGVEKAKELATRAVELDESNADYHFFLSRIHHFLWEKDKDVESDNFKQAEKELLEAKRLNPHGCKYPLFLARLYMDAYWATEKDEFIEGTAGEAGAIGMYEWVVHLYPTNPRFWLEYGDALAQVDREKEMIDAYKKARSLQRKVDQRHVMLTHEEAAIIELRIMQYEDKILNALEE